MKRMQKLLVLALTFVFLLSAVVVGIPTTVDAEEDVKTLHVLGPEGATGKFKFSERDRYSVWSEFEKLMDEYGLDLEFEVVA